MSESINGLVVVDKPAGWTSHQVVAAFRRLVGTRRVGHAGTLDPMATGVLLVGIGRATRLLGHLMLTDKSYRATIRLGVSTVTDDAEGDVLTTSDAAALSEEQIHAAIGPFRGAIEQVPSQVSAIKVNGVRSYTRVRQGEQVPLRARPVTVHRYEVLGLTRHGATIDVDVLVDCTSGTYIRALARDLGVALGCGGHLTALRRTAVGAYTLDSAVTPQDAAAALPLIDLATAAASAFPVVEVGPAEADDVRHGRRLVSRRLTGLTAVFAEKQFLALYRPDEQGARAEAVFDPA